MRKIVFLCLTVLLAVTGCEKKTVIDCRDLAKTVTDKALTIIDRGHYTGSCLYVGMAELGDERLLPIIDGLVSGKISAAGGSLIN